MRAGEVPAPSSKFSNLLPVDLKDQCGGLARGKYSGEITSPGYPDAYPGDIECNWLIRVHRGKQIYVKLVDLQLTEGMRRFSYISGLGAPHRIGSAVCAL